MCFAGFIEPAEIKVEVFWGRAYLALIDTSGYGFGKCTEEGVDPLFCSVLL